MLQQDQQQLQQEAWEEAMPASYQLWRSRQLLALDVHFCVLYVFTHIVYGVKTAKHLCPRVTQAGGGSIISRWAAAVLCTNNVASSVMTHATAALASAAWPLPGRLLLRSVAVLLLRPVAVLLQVLFTGVQVGQPVHPGPGVPRQTAASVGNSRESASTLINFALMICSIGNYFLAMKCSGLQTQSLMQQTCRVQHISGPWQ
jgi:hypothetical protein